MRYLFYFACLNLLISGNVLSKETNQVFSLSKAFFNFVKNKSEYVLEKSGGNTQCAKDLKMLIGDFVHGKKWALEMLDASAKFPTGVMQGNHFVPGNFDQCINIREDKNETLIQGKYCSVVLTPSTEFSNNYTFIFDGLSLSQYWGKKMMRYEYVVQIVKVTYGICIPKSCSIENLQTIWDYLEHSLGVPVHVSFVDLLCRSKDTVVEPYKYVDEVIIILFIIYGSILAISTLYDVLVYQYLTEKKDTILISFSMYTNSKKLFSTSNQDGNTLGCVNGLKVLSTIWVIFGHRFLTNIISGIQNAVYMYEWNQQIFSTLVYSAFFAVDTFFVISGMLLSYNFLKYQGMLLRHGRMNYCTFYMYRLLRLCPALLATVLFYVTIFKKLGDGPLWPLISRKFAGCCLTSGWATMLFVVNFQTLDKQCLEHSWYLAIDTQMYIIAPVLLVNLLRNAKKTITVCVTGCVLSGLYAFVITLYYNYGAVLTNANSTYYKNIYNSTVVRMPPWIIGFVFGYVLYKYQHIKIPKPTVLAAWTISLSSLVLFILIHLVFTRYNYSPLSAALFNCCAKQLWSITICSIIFLCASGHGGIINSFLSQPFFQILVKITYSTYLIHVVVLTYFAGTKRHSEYFSNIKGLHDLAGDLVVVFIVSTVWCLAFESPFLSISKIWYKNGQRSNINDEVGKQVNTEESTSDASANKEKVQ